jgi:hypothetical protein
MGAMSDLQVNAWSGHYVHADTPVLNWGVRTYRDPFVRAPPAKDLSSWEDQDIGWGLVLPSGNVDNNEKHRCEDAALPLRELAHRRSAPVFRYERDVPAGKVRQYDEQGLARDLALTGARGRGPYRIPEYLLIAGSPAEIPWSYQYQLQTGAMVGRLDLDDAGLGHYVEGLLCNWANSDRQAAFPTIWAVDHGHPDITRLMRKVIADPLAAKFSGDPEFDMGGGYLVDRFATHANLRERVQSRRPAFVATSSHGAIQPLTDPQALLRQVGVMVDVDHSPLDLRAAPDPPLGSIWYAHACCSAGCDAPSSFQGAVGASSTLGDVLSALATVGPATAPLPRALLGKKQPIGAFVGHVEPTFDWTLQDRGNKQVTSGHIVSALYDTLHRADRPSIGFAMATYLRHVGYLITRLNATIDEINAMRADVGEAFMLRLIVDDLRATVILGDPTVRLPLPNTS